MVYKHLCLHFTKINRFIIKNLTTIEGIITHYKKRLQEKLLDITWLFRCPKNVTAARVLKEFSNHFSRKMAPKKMALAVPRWDFVLVK